MQQLYYIISVEVAVYACAIGVLSLISFIFLEKD